MKKLIFAAILVIAASDGFAQGTVIFANHSHTIITNHLTGLPAPGGPEQNDTQVGLYVGNVGDPVSSMTMFGPPTNCFLPGRFSGGTRTLPWVGTVQLQVRVWLSSTVYPSYEAAYAAAFGGGSVQLGASIPEIVGLAIPPTPPVSIASAGLSLIVIPEPSTLALGLLGLGALFLSRRKK